MNRILLWVACLGALLLGSVACQKQMPAALPELRLSPSSFNGSVNMIQQIQITPLHLSSKEKSTPTSLDALVEISPEKVKIAGFAMGQRILNLSWDGQNWESTRHPLLPPEFKESQVLRDLQYASWPLEVVCAALPAGWTFSESGLARTLSLENVPKLLVRYENRALWQGDMTVDNVAENYRLRIRSKPVSGRVEKK